MDRLKPNLPSGYVLRDKDDVAEILAIEAELLRSEGIDPRWPGFGPTGKGENVRANNDEP